MHPYEHLHLANGTRANFQKRQCFCCALNLDTWLIYKIWCRTTLQTRLWVPRQQHPLNWVKIRNRLRLRAGLHFNRCWRTRSRSKPEGARSRGYWGFVQTLSIREWRVIFVIFVNFVRHEESGVWCHPSILPFGRSKSMGNLRLRSPGKLSSEILTFRVRLEPFSKSSQSLLNPINRYPDTFSCN